MKLLPLLGAALALSSSLVSAATIEGKLTNLTSFEGDTLAYLTSYTVDRTVPVLVDHSFKFEQVPAGEYVLKISDRVNKYLAYHIHVPEAEEAIPMVTVWQPAIGKVPGATVAGWPMSIPAQGVWVYKDPPPAFDILKVLRGNPLILLLGVGVLITLGGPALLGKLDPEGMKEVTERSAGMHQCLANLQNADVAGSMSKYLAGAVDPQSEVKDVQPTASASGVQAPGAGGGGGTPGKGKGKKRK